MSLAIDLGIDPKNVRGVFLDNDNTHLVRMKATYDKMLTIRIPDSTPFDTDRLRPVPFEGTSSFASFVQSELADGNLYCAALQLLGRDGDSYDKLSGIQKGNITKLYELLSLLRTSSPGPLYVLLDWDRTLTMVEGYLGVESICKRLPSVVKEYKAQGILPAETDLDVITEEHKEHMYEDQLRYLFGGAGRLALIRGMLDHLSNRGIHVWILTNNTGCTSDDFQNMVMHLDQGKGRIQRIICASFKTDTVGRRGNKTFAFTSELLEVRKGNASAPASASAPSNSAASSSGNSSASSSDGLIGGSRTGGSRKTHRRHGPGRNRTRGQSTRSKKRAQRARARRVKTIRR